MIREIAGRQNHSVKLAHKLQKKKHRRARGLLVADGLDLLEIAIQAGAEIRDVLVRADLLRSLPRTLVDRAEAGALDIGICSEDVLAAASSLGGAADVVFMSTEPAWSLGDLDFQNSVVAFLDEVGDPGNVGTLARSGIAFGAGGLVCSPGCADPYGPKAMRAGMGAQFLLPVVTEVLPEDLLARLGKLEHRAGHPVRVVVADSQRGDDARTLSDECAGGVVVVLGAERRGPGKGWRDAPRVCIPQRRFDSLNVAMAGTILLYELSRVSGGNQTPGSLGL